MNNELKTQSRVLIVGCDQLIRSNLARLFRRHGARVTITKSMNAARGQLCKYEFDLMLYDLFMGEYDRGALLDWACKKRPELSSVAISGPKPYQQGMDTIAVARELREHTVIRSSLDPELSQLLFNSFPCFSGPAMNASITHFDGRTVTFPRAVSPRAA